jgi:hypothetical protein
MRSGFLLAVALLVSATSVNAQSFFKVRVENTGRLYPNLASGAFDTPVGASSPGVLLPGNSWQFSFDAAVGHHVSFATMFVQSNDLFYAPVPTGIPLYDSMGDPRSGDISGEVMLWDAGTELNEVPGEGVNQAPRQTGANTGGADTDGAVRLVNDGFSYPAVEDVVQASLTHESGTRFQVTITNVSTDGTLVVTGGSVAVPLAPGVFVVHASDAEPLFSTGVVDQGRGLEALAEDGSAAPLAASLGADTGVPTIFAPVVWAVHRAGASPIFEAGSAPRANGVEDLAEDGNPAPLQAALAADGLMSAGVASVPVGGDSAGPLLPSLAYEFVVYGTPGDRLSLAGMFVQSNDFFLGTGSDGLALFEGSTAVSGDVTGLLTLWDAGTEVNEVLGAGPNQAPRQTGGNTGAVDPDATVRVAAGPMPAEIATVTIVPLEAEGLTLRIENISTDVTLALSTGGGAAVPLAPGAWAVHTSGAPLFAENMADRGRGLEAVAEDGNPAGLAGSLAAQAGVRSGVFNTPEGASGPGPLLPGASYSFSFEAAVGASLSFATMFVQSNDLFYAPGENGLSLWDASGTLRLGDITADIMLWDAGTEMNQEPGVGADQAPRQSGADTGGEDTVTEVRAVSDAFTYPAVQDVIRVTLVRSVSTAAEAGPEVPSSVRLSQNYPNPFNPSTLINFELEQAGSARLAVFDLLGRQVRVLANRGFQAGAHTAVWDGMNAFGAEAASGIYLYRLETDSAIQVRSMTLLR